MPQDPHKLNYAKRVDLYSSTGRFVWSVSGSKAQSLLAAEFAVRKCTGRTVRALELTPPATKDIGTFDGPTLLERPGTRYVFRERIGGKTSRPAIVYSLTTMGDKDEDFTRERQADLMAVLLGAGADTLKGGDPSCGGSMR